jgi:hypothetical protein
VGGIFLNRWGNDSKLALFRNKFITKDHEKNFNVNILDVMHKNNCELHNFNIKNGGLPLFFLDIMTINR